jgi:hypothetical protein
LLITLEQIRTFPFMKTHDEVVKGLELLNKSITLFFNFFLKVQILSMS